MTTTQVEIELKRETYSNSKYLAKAMISAARFVGHDILPTLHKSRSSDPRIGTIEHYRQYLDQSNHYALELAMHRAITQQLICESAPKKDDYKINDSNSPESELLEAHNDYFYGCFALDDYLDHSLYRGNLIAYHERYSPSAAVQIYNDCRDRLIDRVKPFGSDNVDQIGNIVLGVNNQLDYEGFHSIDINNAHNPRLMLERLSKKAQIISGLTLETVRIISRGEVRSDVRNGLNLATEGMWLSSDLKEITHRHKFLELISGRINYPMADMLTNLDNDHRAITQSRVSKLWHTSRAITDIYLPYETKLGLLPFIYTNSETGKLIQEIETAWRDNGTIDRVNGLIDDRVNQAFEYGIMASSRALDLYNFAAYYHVTKTRSRLGQSH